jgi:hypothetical protein
MTLLQVVIDEAQGTGSVPTLLRRLKVLATRTGARDTLLPWVNNELTGYPSEDDVLPSYRGPFPVAPEGDYVGMGATSLTGHPVARTGFAEKAAEVLFTQSFFQPIAEIEAAAAEKRIFFSWPAEAVAYYNSLISAGKAGVASHWGCLQVKYTVAPTLFIGILDQVRTLTLDLALELEQATPQAGEPHVADEINSEARQVIEQTFHFHGLTVTGTNLTIGGQGPAHQSLIAGQERPMMDQ